MDEKTKTGLMAGGAILVILIAIVAVVTMAVRPTETVNDFSKVPPKGIGKFEKDEAREGGKM
jgi:hypothetical protein